MDNADNTGTNQPVAALYEATFKDILLPARQPLLTVFVLGTIINLAGITTDFFTNDPGLYGLLAKNMVQNHNYINLMYRGHDWLDKPHFPFWVAALSFNIFGINTFAFKLPALLFYFMSVVYTYKLAKKCYGFDTAIIAVLVLLTAQHVIMSNTDVRAEPYIMGLLMGSVYHFYKLKIRFKVADLLLASLFAACAVMTKGIYLLIPIGSAIIGDYLFKKDYEGLFQWRWLMAFALVAVFILPEIYTLYLQFDAHPEKMVFNRTRVSGIHWFLWDSQFGRFNSTGYITRIDGDKFFYLHTLLWAFAPWALLLYYSLFIRIKNVVKGVPVPEYLALSGSLVMLIIFSVSAFQLPFYTNILFPFFAIITAVYINKVIEKNRGGYFKIVQYLITGALIVLITAVSIVFSPGHFLTFILFTVAFAFLTFYLYKNSRSYYRFLFLFTCCVAIWANAYIIIAVYPTLLSYKGEVQAAKLLNGHPELYKGGDIIAAFDVPDPFEFYTQHPVKFTTPEKLLVDPPSPNSIVLADDSVINYLEKKKSAFTILKRFDNYPNENLTLPFIIEKEREKSLNHYFLIRWDKKLLN